MKLEYPTLNKRELWTQTKVVNPTEHVQRLTFLDEENQPEEIVWQPGEVREIPVVWARCIHSVDVHEDGTQVIIGGLAPLLVWMEHSDRLIHPMVLESCKPAAKKTLAGYKPDLSKFAKKDQ